MAGRLSRGRSPQRRRSRDGRYSGSSSIWISGGTGSSSWRSGGAFLRETHSRNPGSSGRGASGTFEGTGAWRSGLGRRWEGGRGRVILCPLVCREKCKGRSRTAPEGRTTQTHEPAPDVARSFRASAERTGSFLAPAHLLRTKNSETRRERERHRRGARSRSRGPDGSQAAFFVFAVDLAGALVAPAFDSTSVAVIR